jgi:ERCC4-type nuclease
MNTDPRPRLKLADCNEPFELVEKLLMTGWQRNKMYSADYYFQSYEFKKVGIERKTASDFVSSLGDRLSSQLDKMLESYDYRILLLEEPIRFAGELVLGNNGFTKWTKHMVRNYLLGWQFRGITIERTQDMADTVNRLNELFTYFQKPMHDGGSCHSNDFGDDRVFAFPRGSRGKTGLKVLENKSLSDVADMSSDELRQIEGIGKVKAQTIYDHFHRKETMPESMPQ